MPRYGDPAMEDLYEDIKGHAHRWGWKPVFSWLLIILQDLWTMEVNDGE